MKRNEFDLTGKAIDCSSLRGQPWGDKVFKALFSVVCDDSDNMFPELNGVPAYETFRYFRLDEDNEPTLSILFTGDVLNPLDILGEARIDAIKDGATVVFEGDVFPPSIESKVLVEKIGSKYDQGKPRYDLVPVHAEAEFVDVLTFGAEKYGPENWRELDAAKERYTAAAMRHLAAYRMGETHDKESGKHHLAHAMCCLAFITEIDLGE